MKIGCVLVRYEGGYFSRKSAEKGVLKKLDEMKFINMTGSQTSAEMARMMHEFGVNSYMKVSRSNKYGNEFDLVIDVYGNEDKINSLAYDISMMKNVERTQSKIMLGELSNRFKN